MIQHVKSAFAIGMVAAALASASASADTSIARVDNYATSTPGCTFISSTGWGNTIVYKLTCSADTVMIAYTNPNTYNCTVSSSDSNYYTSGSCSGFTVYKKTPPPQPVQVKLTDVTNNSSATNSCAVTSVGGYSSYGYTYVGYRVTCPSDTIYVNTTTNSTGSCSLSTSSPYSVNGSCSSYSIFKTVQQ